MVSGAIIIWFLFVLKNSFRWLTISFGESHWNIVMKYTQRFTKPTSIVLTTWKKNGVDSRAAKSTPLCTTIWWLTCVTRPPRRKIEFQELLTLRRCGHVFLSFRRGCKGWKCCSALKERLKGKLTQYLVCRLIHRSLSGRLRYVF